MERNERMTAAAAPARTLPGPYVDWAAVLGGAVVAAATGGLFSTFGAALGLSTISAEPGEASSINLLLIVTALWIVVSLIASYLAGGYVAGRMRRRVDDASAEEVAARDGINGLVVWGLGMLVTAWMALGTLGAVATTATSAAGSLAEGAGAALGGAAEGAATAAGTVMDDGSTSVSWISDSLMRSLPGSAAAPAAPAATGAPAADAAAPAPSATAEEDAAEMAERARQSGSILTNALRTGEVSDTDRAYLVAAVTAGGSTPEDAEARVDQAIAAVQQTRTEVAQRADEAEAAAREAAETARVSGILTAFLLTAASIVAAVAAVAGAVRGGRHRDEGRLYGGLSYRV